MVKGRSQRTIRNRLEKGVRTALIGCVKGVTDATLMVGNASNVGGKGADNCKKKGKSDKACRMKKETESETSNGGVDISVISKQLAMELELPLSRTRMQIKPYGMNKRIKCIGYYVGPIMHKESVANVGVYVVKDNVEALLSGATSQALGIISFHGKPRGKSVAKKYSRTLTKILNVRVSQVIHRGREIT